MLRLVWAVDPFGDPALLVAAVKNAASLVRLTSIEVLPVYVLPPWVKPMPMSAMPSDTGFGVPRGEVAGPFWPTDPNLAGRIRDQARARFKEVIDRLQREERLGSAAAGRGKGLRFLPLEVLPPGLDAQENSGMRYQVDELSAYARENDAASILVCTHARRRSARAGGNASQRSSWLIGSFAETLIERSEIPVISVQPFVTISAEKSARASASPSQLREMLFATDFSRESAYAFATALEFASALNLPVLLYHCLEPPAPILDIAYSPYLLYANEKRQERAQQQAALWLARARRHGVRTRVRIEEAAESVAESVTELARKRSSLIAMAGRSGPVASALLGSVTRNVVRLAASPVWVLHVSRRKAKSQAKLKNKVKRGRAA